jgi:hypothetical protein
MKKLIPIIMLLMTASAANAGGLVTKHASSVQLTVDAARSTASRIGSSFAISGSNIDTTDGTTAGTVSAGTITSGVYSPGAIAATQDTAGAAFSFAQSYTQADAVPTGAATVGVNPNFSSLTSVAAGAKDTLAGTLTSASVIGITAGGAGTTATGQFVSEITVID